MRSRKSQSRTGLLLLVLIVGGAASAVPVPIQGQPGLSLNVAVSAQTREPFVPMFLTRLEVPVLRLGLQQNSVLFELAHSFDSAGGVQFLRLGGTTSVSIWIGRLESRLMVFAYWYLVQGRGSPHGEERGFSQRLFWQLRLPTLWFSVDMEVAYTVSRSNWWVGIGLRF